MSQVDLEDGDDYFTIAKNKKYTPAWRTDEQDETDLDRYVSDNKRGGIASGGSAKKKGNKNRSNNQTANACCSKDGKCSL